MAMRKAAKPQLARYAWTYARHLIERVPDSAAEHERIIDAILAGDADGAERAVLENWSRAAERLDRAIERGGS